MSIDLSTRRSTKITLVANVVYEFSLESVYQGKNIVIPNVVQIRSLNTSDIIYMDYSNRVSSTYYVQSINPLTNRKHVTSSTATKLYFLTASNCDVEITIAYDPEPNVSDLDDTQETNIINATLTVGTVAISSIAAGDNNIGNVDLASAIPAGDNNIGNVDLASSIPAGDNNIGNVDIASALPAGDNNIGNVDLASAIPAGTNTIGKVKLTDGTDDLAIESDGSINVNIGGGTINVTATEVQITDGTDNLAIETDGSININVASALPAGDNNIGNVDIASALPAGTNNIGDVDVLTIGAGQNIKPATTPAIYNVTCTNANTEYSQALPANTKKFSITVKSRSQSLTWQFKTASSGTAFYLKGHESVCEDNVLLASQTLYFETDSAGEVVQIIAWS